MGQDLWLFIHISGLDDKTQKERKVTVQEHFKGLLERMINEEKGKN